MIYTGLIDAFDIIELNRNTLPENLLPTFYSSYYTSYRLFHYSDFISHSKTTGLCIIKSLFSSYIAGRYNISARKEKYNLSDELLDYDIKFYDGLWNLFCKSFLGTSDIIRAYSVPDIKHLTSLQMKGTDLLKEVIEILENLAAELIIQGADIESVNDLSSKIEIHAPPNLTIASGKSFDTHSRFVFYAFALMKMSFVGSNFNTNRNDLLLDAGTKILDLYFAEALKKYDKRLYHRSLYNGQNSEHYTDFIGLPLTFKSIR